MADPHTATIEDMYRAFNERDIDGVLIHLAPEVDWPNAATGARIIGRAAVKAYWQKQWLEIDPRVEPLSVMTTPDGRVHVRVDQLVRDKAGKILDNRQLEHVYDFDGPFVARMTIVDTAPADDDEDED